MAKYLSDPEGSADNYGETTTLPDMDARCSSGDDDCAALPDKLPPLSEARRRPVHASFSHFYGSRVTSPGAGLITIFGVLDFQPCGLPGEPGLPKFLAIYEGTSHDDDECQPSR
jgi:hypothetical protein